MTLVNVDMSPEALETPVFVPVEPGTYQLEIMNDLEVGKAKSSDSKVIPVELEITTDGPEKGKTVYDTLVLGDKTNWKIGQITKSAGVEPTAEGIDLTQFRGRIVEAIIAQSPYKKTDGSQAMRNQVKEYLFVA